MQHVVFLFQHRLPAEFDNGLEAKSLVVFLPAMPNKYGVGLRQRSELEFWGGCSPSV